MATQTNPDPNARSLYVGNIDPRVTDAFLQETFGANDGKVSKIKLIKDKQTGASCGFGFIEFESHEAAQAALQKFNGFKLMDFELKVNWANSSPSQNSHHNNTGANSNGHQNNFNSPKLGANGLYNVFVGDLDVAVDDALLESTFKAYPSLTDARVMVDHETNRSRGYGFIMFKEKQDAQQAIQEMNGKSLLNRSLRLNWAHPRSENPSHRKPTQVAPLDYNDILAHGSETNVTVYVGNLAPELTEAALKEAFSVYGEIQEVRAYSDKGYGFIMFKERENAAHAIVGLNGKTLGSKQIKCHWGREKEHQVPLQNTTGLHLPGNPYISQNQAVYSPYQYQNLTYPPFQYPFPMAQPGAPGFAGWWPQAPGPWNPQLVPVAPFPAGAASQTPQQNTLKVQSPPFMMQ